MVPAAVEDVPGGLDVNVTNNEDVSVGSTPLVHRVSRAHLPYVTELPHMATRDDTQTKTKPFRFVLEQNKTPKVRFCSVQKRNKTSKRRFV